MNYSLYWCIKRGDMETFKDMASIHILHTETTFGKNTALQVAIQYGRIDFVVEIINRCPLLLFRQNLRGDTALHLATRAGLSEIVEVLINCAQRVRTGDDDLEPGEIREETPNQRLVRMVNNDMDSALHLAVRIHSIDIVKLLTEADLGSRCVCNSAAETPLYLAAEMGLSDIVKQILDTCVSAAHDGPYGRTAMHAAVISNNSAITKMLINQRKHLVKEEDDKGWNPLHCAVYFGFHERVEDLLRCDKTIISLPARDGRTALHVAASRGSSATINKIIDLCPDCWELLDSNGQNFLHIAIRFRHEHLVKLILERCTMLEGLLNDSDIDGNTPLHLSYSYMAHNRHINYIILNDVRVKKNILNKENFTAADIFDKKNTPEEIYIRGYRRNSLSEWNGGRSNRRNSFFSEWIHRMRRKQIVEITHSINGVIQTEFEDKWVHLNTRNPRKHICEVEEEETKHMFLDDKGRKELTNMQLVVATLIATVTFAAGVTLPGGVKGSGLYEGTATLVKLSAFRAFVISNAMAMMFSITAVLLHVGGIGINKASYKNLLIGHTHGCLVWGILSMVVAFMTGSYSVLHNSPGLAKAVCAICSTVVYVAYTTIRDLHNRKSYSRQALS